MDIEEAARRARLAVADAGDHDGNSPRARTTAIAFAFMQEVRAQYEEFRDKAAPELREAIQVAIGLANTDPDGILWDGDRAWIICAGLNPPSYCTVKRPGLRDPWRDPENYTPCLQMMFSQAQPLWMHYLPIAQKMMAERKSNALVTAVTGRSADPNSSPDGVALTSMSHPDWYQ